MGRICNSQPPVMALRRATVAVALSVLVRESIERYSTINKLIKPVPCAVNLGLLRLKLD